MSRLCELAEKYGSDKTAKFRHPYTPFYDELLRDRNVQRVLEIGIGTPACMNSFVPNYEVGASLRMWRDYFPAAEIVGLDNDPSAFIQEDRILSVKCDQSSRVSLVSTAQILGGKFDFIVDDGSHRYDHQALTANTLIPKLLSSTGVYVIEDVMYPKELYALLNWPAEVKLFDYKRTPDDCLFIIEGSKI